MVAPVALATATMVLMEGKPKDRTVTEPPLCQVCGAALSTGPVVVCRTCKTAHHRECWRYNRGCSVFGCRCKIFEAPPPAPGQAGGSFTVTQPPSGWVAGCLIFCAVLCLLGGILGGTHAGWVLGIIGGFSYGVLLTSAILYQTRGYHRLTFSPADELVERQLMIFSKRCFRPERQWLRAEDIVEVHLHRFEDPRMGAQELLYVALADGTRRLLQRSVAFGPSRSSQEDLERLAERVAAFADTTVRFVEGLEAPSAEEMQVAQRERAAALTSDAGGEDS